MKASPMFAGYFTNTNTFNGNIQYRLSKKINVMAIILRMLKILKETLYFWLLHTDSTSNTEYNTNTYPVAL
jgi:hypothetical protein